MVTSHLAVALYIAYDRLNLRLPAATSGSITTFPFIFYFVSFLPIFLCFLSFYLYFIIYPSCFGYDFFSIFLTRVCKQFLLDASFSSNFEYF
jgi:hypothetical protein